MFGSRGRCDVLLVGLGNPGTKYAATRHNIGFEVVNALADRWDLGRAKKKFNGLLTEGRAGQTAARVAALLPQTFMNEAGKSAGPALGSFKLKPDRLIVVHDEIDLPFGEVQSRLGGGLAGHNGLKSIAREVGGKEFWRVRVGVGRPDSTDPKIVSAYVLGKFSESNDAVSGLIERAAEATESLIAELA